MMDLYLEYKQNNMYIGNVEFVHELIIDMWFAMIEYLLENKINQPEVKQLVKKLEQSIKQNDSYYLDYYLDYNYLFCNNDLLIKQLSTLNLVGILQFIKKFYNFDWYNCLNNNNNIKNIKLYSYESSNIIDSLYLISPFLDSKYFNSRQKVPWQFYFHDFLNVYV